MEVDSLTLGTSAYTPPAAKTYDSPASRQAAPESAPAAEVADKPPAADMQSKMSNDKNQKEFKFSEDDIKKTIDTANKKVQPLFLEFHYRIHDKTNQLMISVINTSTKEIVREIPPERALDALAKMWELTGIIVDKNG